MKIYIADIITSNPHYKEHFACTEKMLKDAGHEVVNSVKPKRKEYKWYIDEGLKQLMTCDGIYMIDGWERSTGAKLERAYAEEVGLKIIYETDLRKLPIITCKNKGCKYISKQETKFVLGNGEELLSHTCTANIVGISDETLGYKNIVHYFGYGPLENMRTWHSEFYNITWELYFINGRTDRVAKCMHCIKELQR